MNFPDHIPGTRVTLRLGHEVDANALFNLVMASKKEIIAFLPWAEKYTSIQSALDTKIKFKAAWDEGVAYAYAIYDADGQFIGMIDWRPGKDCSGSIGYWLGTAYTGHGYMTEALCTLIDVLYQQGVNRAVVCCKPDNQASSSVAKRAGFTYEGRLRQARQVPTGEFYDLLQFSRLASDPKPS